MKRAFCVRLKCEVFMNDECLVCQHFYSCDRVALGDRKVFEPLVRVQP